ncbi:hypothetical protein G8761_18385 [Bacillus sp. C11]|nr:hypothetical protein [Neobacillus terrae]NHM32537.1 hypothetical protein [Neobacillus terrae]
MKPIKGIFKKTAGAGYTERSCNSRFPSGDQHIIGKVIHTLWLLGSRVGYFFYVNAKIDTTKLEKEIIIIMVWKTVIGSTPFHRGMLYHP